MAKNEEMYLTGPNAFKAYASQNNEEFSPAAIPRGHAKAFQSRTFENWDTNVSIRSDYNRGDYEYFRPSYTVPQEQKQIISMCMAAYQKVGLVRNVIDLMGDFGSQGIRIQHPIKSMQDFYNNWFEKVGGPMVSERFMNLLYRAGQVVIKPSYGKVSVTEERKMKKSRAAEEVKLPKTTVTKREIPLKYTFMDILSLEVLGQEVSSFVGQPALALRLTPKLKSTITALMADREKLTVEIQKMMDRIPKDVADAIQKGQQYLPLDMDKVSVYYYKKDDWQLWADPLIASLLDDLLMLNKLKLADISALDGAISNIRLWTLGIIGDSPATSIMPTKAGINKLRGILANNVGGGVLDLVYGPELKFTESNSQVWRFLGSEKYQVTLNNIYEGLGIPSSLRAGKGQSNTGNYVGLNTLVKRLQYGRSMLIDFWNKELKYVHKAMGFPGVAPKVVFDFMALADEAAEKQLLINLWDRDIISDETIVELFGRLPDIEKARVKKEARDRMNEVMPYKASPFHNPDKEHDYRKILLQLGTFAPSEIGIDLQDRKTDEQSHMEKMHDQEMEKMDKEGKIQTDLQNTQFENEKQMMDKEMENDNQFRQQELDQKLELQKDQHEFKKTLDKQKMQQQLKMKRQGTPGRPSNTTETKKRKPKPTGKPSTKADFMNLVMWANSAQDTISEMVTKSILAGFGKATLRSLSNDEFDMYEKVKLDILCSLLPFEEITAEKVHNALANSQGINMAIAGSVKTLEAQFVLSRNRQPKVDELRQIYSTAYALVYEN